MTIQIRSAIVKKEPYARRFIRPASPFLVFSLSGLASLLLDLDHVLVLMAKGLPITFYNLAREAGRPLHWPIFLVSGFVCVLFGAYLLRFYWTFLVNLQQTVDG